MTQKTIEYFDWTDIQTEICKTMNLDEKYFRDYHEVVGGEYKDLWHSWLEYFDSEITNGSIHYNDLGETLESKLEWIKSDNREWLEPFVKAVYEVFDKYGIQYIKYSW